MKTETARKFSAKRSDAQVEPGGEGATRNLPVHPLTRGLICAVALAFAPALNAQNTNWIAYNDHRATPFPGANGWFTAPSVTTYDFFNTPSGGNLTDLLTGAAVPVTVLITKSPSGVRDQLVTERPNLGTPAAQLFRGIADIGGNGIIGLEPGGSLVFRFANLNPSKRYLFRATSVRGGSYFDRWTVCTLTGAVSCIDAHTGLGGTNVITKASFPTASLGANQVAFCSGENRAAGDVIGWDEIQPDAAGSFAVISEMYRGPVPTGRDTAAPAYAYAPGVFMMAETEPTAVPITILTQPAAQTIVPELLPFSIGVTVEGSSPSYQWYKEEVGPVPGATMRAHSVAAATLADSGNYFVVISNSLGAVTSTVALVTVIRDLEPPNVTRVEPRLNHLSLIVTFSELVTRASAEQPAAYTVAGVNPLAATLDSRGSNVLLTLPMALAFDTTNLLTVTGLQDHAPAQNTMPFTQISFRTPVLSRGFLRADYYLGIQGLRVSDLTGSPKFPDVYEQTLYRTTSTALPDFGNYYGLRLWGFFIPPTNGNYTFYVRSDDESEVYLSSNANPANKRLVASQTGWDRPYDDNNGYPRFSTMPGLVAGQLYYLDVLLKESSVADHLTLVYKAEGERPPVHEIPSSVTVIPSASLACYADTEAVSIQFLEQPASTNVLLGQSATFSVAASVVPLELASLVLYQWQRAHGLGAFTNIPGATTRRYTTPPVVLADNGAAFACRVTVPGAVRMSDAASVGVSALSPRIVSVARESQGTNLTFIIATQTGASYVVQYTDTLSPPSWQPLSAVSGTGGEVLIRLALTDVPSRFYRIKVE